MLIGLFIFVPQHDAALPAAAGVDHHAAELANVAFEHAAGRCDPNRNARR
jgi:hypothetical protein